MAAWLVAADRSRAAYDLTGATQALTRATTILQSTDDGTVLGTWLCHTLTLRGDTLRLLADFQRATQDLTWALRAAETDLQRAGVWNALGILAKDENRFDDAERWYRQALEAAEASPACSSVLAAVFHNLAGLDHARGSYATGERHLQRALQVHATPPVDVAALLADRGVLAALLSAQRRDAEAEALLRELIDGWARLRGLHHYEVAHCRYHLGVLMARNGRHPEADEELTEAYAVMLSVLGAQHPQTTAIACALGASAN